MAPISDDEALRIDRAVSTLKRRADERYTVLTDYYLRGWSLSRISRHYRTMTRKDAGAALARAESWIESQLFDDDEII